MLCPTLHWPLRISGRQKSSNLLVKLIREVGGVKLFITSTVANYLFDKIVAPVVVWTYREGMIAVDVIAVKKAVGKYKDAVAKIDRINAFDNLP